MAVGKKLVVPAGYAHVAVLAGNGRDMSALRSDIASRGLLLDLVRTGRGSFAAGVAFRSIVAGKVEACVADDLVFRSRADADGDYSLLVGQASVSTRHCKTTLAPCLLLIFLARRSGGSVPGCCRNAPAASRTPETDMADDSLCRCGVATVPVVGLEDVGRLPLT